MNSSGVYGRRRFLLKPSNRLYGVGASENLFLNKVLGTHSYRAKNVPFELLLLLA